MSWWVMEQVSVNESGTQSLVNIQCDDVSDLPSPDQTATAGYTIVRGSQAKVLATSENYILGSTGTWVKMEDGVKLDLTGYATEQYVDDGLADKVDTSVYSSGQAAQETEIGVVVAMGAKNRLKQDNDAGYTLTTHGRTFEVLADGGIKITGDTSDSSYADFYVSGKWGGRDVILNSSEENCILSFDCSDALQTNNLYIRAVDRRTGSTANTAIARLRQESEFNFPITTVLITVEPSVVLPSGGITVYPMIRNAAIKDPAFSPYAPTNRELYEMILALQGG